MERRYVAGAAVSAGLGAFDTRRGCQVLAVDCDEAVDCAILGSRHHLHGVVITAALDIQGFHRRGAAAVVVEGGSVDSHRCYLGSGNLDWSEGVVPDPVRCFDPRVLLSSTVGLKNTCVESVKMSCSVAWFVFDGKCWCLIVVVLMVSTSDFIKSERM